MANPKLVLTDSESEQTNQGLVQMQTNQELVQMANPELVQICQRILNEFGLFKDSDDAGPLNFLIAFKMLSLTQIEHDLSEPEEENQRRHGRIRGQVRHYVVKEYFLDLLYNHRITAVSQLKTPRQWCEERLKQVNYDPEIHRNKREQMADCLVYTNKLVQNPSHRNNPDLIFQAMYTDWCNNDIRLLLYSDGLYLLSDSAYDTYKKKLNYNVEYFTEEYFYYYGQVLHSLDHTQGNFRSINQYCEDVGYRLLQGVVL